MMLQDATESSVSVKSTPIEMGVAVESRLRKLAASVRFEDAPTPPCACSNSARYELPSVRNLGPPQVLNVRRWDSAPGRKPAAQWVVCKTVACRENPVKPMLGLEFPSFRCSGSFASGGWPSST